MIRYIKLVLTCDVTNFSFFFAWCCDNFLDEIDDFVAIDVDDSEEVSVTISFKSGNSKVSDKRFSKNLLIMLYLTAALCTSALMC